MQDIEINAQTLNITLGRAGENEVRRLIMDVSDWAAEFPGGDLALFMERPDGVCYNAAVEQQEAAWIHVVSAADTGAAGRGRMARLCAAHRGARRLLYRGPDNIQRQKIQMQNGWLRMGAGRISGRVGRSNLKKRHGAALFKQGAAFAYSNFYKEDFA